MSRLTLQERGHIERLMDQIKDETGRQVSAEQNGICPVDFASSYLRLCHAQSCGKCVPCRVGLSSVNELLDRVLNGTADENTLTEIEKTAQSIYLSADCVIGFGAAKMVLQILKGFREDFIEHIRHDRCKNSFQGVPCVDQCPAHVDIPGYIALIHEGRYNDAVNLIRQTNPLPATCGLVCEHPCETQCRRHFVDEAVNIRGLKRYAVEQEKDILLPNPLPSTGKKVAVVGGGPAGLTAAYFLTLMGHKVTLYERRKKLGGMLRYGIPAYRLPREILDREINAILSLGIEVHLETTIGEKLPFEKIREEFDAVYLAIGAHASKSLGIEGEDASGVHSAVEMLRSIGDEEYPDFSGQVITVIGGGNVAMDVARSAIRLGAAEVKIIYRRRLEDMPAQTEEIEAAVAEGCEVMELRAPLRIEKESTGKVEALWVQPQIVGSIQGGRPSVHNAQVTPEKIACDKVLVAIGQDMDYEPFQKAGIAINRQGTFAADEAACLNGMAGVFAGGDAVTGPATVIRAIAGGKVAAANIDEFLGCHNILMNNIELPSVPLVDNDPCGRVKMKERLAAERKTDFSMVEYCMSDEEAMQESGRCLHCDHFGCGIVKGRGLYAW